MTPWARALDRRVVAIVEGGAPLDLLATQAQWARERRRHERVGVVRTKASCVCEQGHPALQDDRLTPRPQTEPPGWGAPLALQCRTLAAGVWIRSKAVFHNILLSLDGSPHATQALTEAIDIALAGRSRLTLLTSVRQCPAWAYSPVSAAAAERLSVDFETEAKQIMCDAVARVPQEVPVTKILTHKPVRQALLERVKSGEYDLLVMGSRGRGGVKASLLGSVSHYALNHSPIPVLIVHTPQQSASEETARQMPATSEAPGLSVAPPPASPA